jgi:hypothetical protein
MEHRRARRLDTDVGVRFVALPSTIGSGRITNICLSGAFMETASKLQLSSVIYIEGLDSGKERGKDGAAKRLAATVVRRCSAGVGLEWCAPAENSLPGLQPDMAAPEGEQEAADEVNEAAKVSGADCCVYRLEFID